MDIDKLFKVPKLPAGSNKRRMPDNPTPEMLKRMRMDNASDDVQDVQMSATTVSSAQDKGKHRATVEDEDEGGRDEAMDFAPGGDADYFAEEDDEGRFFGGGLTKEQKDILNIFDQAGGDDVREDLEDMTIVGVRRLLTRFERAMNKNQDQRSKYPDDPTKFIDSEADLDLALKALLPLAQSPVLAYPEIIRTGTVERLIGLLSHENMDIAIDVVEAINEFTDEDAGNDPEDEEEEEEQGSREDALKQLIESFLANSILELLVDNLSRFNEAEESDRQGVFHVLGIFENILGFNSELSVQLVSKTKILPWLLSRIAMPKHDENRGYAAEILSILLQTNRPNRLEFGNKDGVETCLKTLSRYRKKDPVSAEESEFMENVFDVLCSALAEPEIKKSFLDSEGVDLMVLIMKDKMQARSRAIKVLDHAMSGPSGTTACETFVEALGLKTLFSSFMGGKAGKKQNVTASHAASEDTAHTLGIVSSLLSNLASETPARIRLLAKFVENNYEKPEKLLEIRDGAHARLRATEKDIEDEKQRMEAEGEDLENMQDIWYLRRLDGGLFTLQTVDYILAWIVMEDDGIRAHVQKLLDRKNQSFKDIVKTLQIYHDNVDDDDVNAIPDGALTQREILQNLIAFLDAC